ncbi:MAG: zinc-dependent peptidase [Bacteroidetes bacterium]|nr:zinc-dependent peptidase [Bacteroidota bacterium]MBK9300561.1 zinc-dependent peptidase [Bacteroidota bacterium]
MAIFFFLLLFAGIAYFLYTSQKSTKKASSHTETEIEQVLNSSIDFYQALPVSEKKENFKNRVVHFIQHVRFTSVGKAKHTLLDEVLIASSAVIPLFHFPNWEYRNIHEVILYDDHFDHQYNVDNDHHIMGMVGEGALNNTMVLSLRALREGFEKTEGTNTAIHEFVHLIDKADGVIDGVPEYLIPKKMIEPWLRHIRATMQDIMQHETQLNPYAATNEAEFLAVMAEYFFEKPTLLSRNHPELYTMLQKIFSPPSTTEKNG